MKVIRRYAGVVNAGTSNPSIPDADAVSPTFASVVDIVSTLVSPLTQFSFTDFQIKPAIENTVHDVHLIGRGNQRLTAPVCDVLFFEIFAALSNSRLNNIDMPLFIRNSHEVHVVIIRLRNQNMYYSVLLDTESSQYGKRLEKAHG